MKVTAQTSGDLIDYALSSHTSCVEVAPGLIVTATLDLRLAEDRLRVRCLRGGMGSTDEGLGLCAVGTLPSGGFCDRFFSMRQDSRLRASLNHENI